MKKAIFRAMALPVLLATALAGCSDDNGPSGNGGFGEQKPGVILFNGNEIGDGRQNFEIRSYETTNDAGETVTVKKFKLEKGVYTLKGWCYVTFGTTLEIEPGTIIKGDKETKAALIVEPGGVLIADGTPEQPIVFTSEQAPGSRKPGDWGGLIVCGRATNNAVQQIIEGGPRTTHGGNLDADSSGVLRYVRVEFAGYPFKSDQEINGITFGSVGSKTVVENVQVSYSNDDSFEWFGGTVNAKHLIAYHGWDDDFDTDNGYSGKLQFLLGVRNPKIADTSLSNGFESDNDKDGSSKNPRTKCVFSNVTLAGPMGQDAAFVNNSSYINGGTLNPMNGSKSGIFQAAMQVRRNSRISCFNSVAMGYPVGLLIDNEKGSSHTAATDGELRMRNLCFAGMGVLGSDVNKSLKDSLSTNGKDFVQPLQESFSSTFFKTAAYNNTYLTAIGDLKLKQPNSLAASPNYGPTTGSPLTGKSGLFADEKLTDDFFDVVDYLGAFRSDADGDDWTKPWAEFDPQHADYSVAF